MRVVVFTGHADLQGMPWWPIVAETPGVEHILICRKVQHLTAGQVLRRFRRNVAKHGLRFIPYRIGLLALEILRRPFRKAPESVPVSSAASVEELEAPDIHSADVLERVRAFAPDLGLSIGAPILRAPLFRIPTGGTINLHLGKVPDFRGAPPAFWELVQNAPTIGATVHWVDEGLDTGAVIAATEAPIYAVDSLRDVEERATELGTIALREAIDLVCAGKGSGRPQASGGATNRFPTLGQRSALARKMRRRNWRRRLAPRYVVKVASMMAALYLYRPVRDALRTIRRRHPVRMFNFHRVTTLCRDGMTVTPDLFRERVKYLARYHELAPLDRAIETVRSSAGLSRPLAVITFDDAYRSVFQAARPILTALHAPASCFVSTDLIGTDRRFDHDDANPVRAYLGVMNWDELETLKNENWTLGTHTANHVRLSACSGELLKREIEEPRRVLRERMNVDASVLAFPFGGQTDISDEALDLARRAGQSTVLRNNVGENAVGTLDYVLGRFDLGGDLDPLAWKCLAHGIDLGRWRGLWPA